MKKWPKMMRRNEEWEIREEREEIGVMGNTEHGKG
jgi:hypothetical protein